MKKYLLFILFILSIITYSCKDDNPDNDFNTDPIDYDLIDTLSFWNNPEYLQGVWWMYNDWCEGEEGEYGYDDPLATLTITPSSMWYNNGGPQPYTVTENGKLLYQGKELWIHHQDSMHLNLIEYSPNCAQRFWRIN